MEINQEIYLKSRRSIEDAIAEISKMENITKYKQYYDYLKELTTAKENLVLLLGKIDYMHENSKELLPTEVYVTVETPQRGRITVINGKYVKMTYNLFSRKERFNVYLKPIDHI